MLNEILEKILFIEKEASAKASAIRLSIDEQKSLLQNKLKSEEQKKLNKKQKDIEIKADKEYTAILEEANMTARKITAAADKKIPQAADYIAKQLWLL